MRYGRSVSSEISQRELRNNSGDIMRRLNEGEAFIVTRTGVPVGELVPMRRRLVNGPALAAAFRGAPRIDHQRLRADLDRAVDQDSTPRG
jgi:prevent-host-death family protein